MTFMKGIIARSDVLAGAVEIAGAHDHSVYVLAEEIGACRAWV